MEAKSKRVYWSGDVSLGQLENDERFRDLWWKVEGVPGSYTRLNAAKLYEYVNEVARGGVVVEIGVDQGRSATVLFEVAKKTEAMLVLVDSWESVLIDNYYKVAELRKRYPSVLTVLKRQRSVEAAEELREGELTIDLLHIDADHYEGIGADCAAWLPMLKVGGVVLFHDYAATFDAVTAAVDKWTGDEECWEDLGSWDGLAIRRRLK